MRKFRLIKEYPGSPELLTVISDENKLVEWKGYNYYEKHSEYWEEINDDIYYLVFTENETSFNAWEPIRVGAVTYDTSTRKYFSTKEDAVNFIIQHKPCLSFYDINNEISTDNSKFRMLHNISELTKSRI